MPCIGPTDEEMRRWKYHRSVADHIIYICEKMGRKAPEAVVQVSKNIYSETDLTRTLCEMLRAMNHEEMEGIVYNARDRRSRELANWWEDHQELDRKHGRHS